MKSWGKLSLLAFALCLIPLLLPAADDEELLILNFATLPEDKPSKLASQIRPFLNKLATELGKILDEPVHIKLKVFPSRELFVRGFKAGKIDIARMEATNYIEVKKAYPKIDLVGVETAGSHVSTKGIIFVREDSFIQGMHDLRRTDIAFGKAKSAFGHFLPQYHLMKHQLLAADLGQIRYFNTPAEIAAQVDDGLMHAGILEEKDFKRLKAEGAPLRQIDSFNGLAPVWVLRQEVAKPSQAALRNAFFKKQASKELKAWGADKLISVTDQDFEEIRRAVWYNWVFNPAPKGN